MRDAASESIPNLNAASFLRRSAHSVPSAVAVIHPDGHSTYAQLLAASVRLAEKLPTRVDRPEPLRVMTEHDPVAPEVYFGILMAGHAIVPVSARLPDSAVARIARSVGALIGLVTPGHVNRLAGLANASAGTRWYESRSGESFVGQTSDGSQRPVGTAMVAYTSGTTGEPKGVLVSHANLLANGITAALVFGIGLINCHINPLPLAHFAGASRVLLAAVNGGSHVVLPGFDPKAVFDAIDRYDGTHLTVSPSMARELLAAEPERFRLGSLETMVYGTAPMSHTVASELQSRLKCGLINGYGLTESTGLVTALDAASHRRAAAEDDEELLSSVGRPVPGVELRIVDDALRDVPNGEHGEILVRGIKVTSGYLDNPEATAERYLPDGWLRTGDQGRFTDEMYVRLDGRIDEMIITGGINVQPLEIEREALRFTGVDSCAAFGVPSEQWGQEVTLAVVLDEGSTVLPEELREFLRGRIDRYKVPKAIHIVDHLPRSSLGKIQRSELSRRSDW